MTRALRARQHSTSHRRRCVATLAAALLLVTGATSTSGAFTGAKAAGVTGASQSAYSCSVNYASTVQSTPGLQNYWRLGETSGNTAVDETGAANGTYVGAPALGGGAAVPSAMGANASASFGSSSSKYMNAGGSADFPSKAPFSLELWVRPTAVTYASLLVKSAAFEFYISGTASNAFLRFNRAGAIVIGNRPVQPNVWHHVVATYDGSVNRLFQDGLLTQESASGINMPTSPSDFLIGSSNPNVGLDEVAIYNRALTPAEVQSHTANCTYASTVARTPNLKSYWRLDEASGTAAPDSGPGNITGTYNDNPARGSKGALPSAVRTSVGFTPPSSQQVNMGDNYDFSGTSPFSIELWANPSVVDPDVYRHLIAHEEGGSNWKIYLEPGTNKPICSRAVPGQYSGIGYYLGIPTNSWTHMMCVFDGTTMSMYLNGETIGYTSASSVSLPSFSTNLTIGSDSYGGSNFNGRLDEVAIYDRALTAGEAAAHYAAR